MRTQFFLLYSDTLDNSYCVNVMLSSLLFSVLLLWWIKFAFSALTLLVQRQEGIRPRKTSALKPLGI